MSDDIVRLLATARDAKAAGRPDEAVRLLAPVVAIVRDPATRCRGAWAEAASLLRASGADDAAEAVLQAIVERRAEREWASAALSAAINLGTLVRLRPDIPAAARYTRMAIAIAREHHDDGLAVRAWSSAALFHATLGDTAGAEAALLRAREHGGPEPAAEAMTLVHLGRVADAARAWSRVAVTHPALQAMAWVGLAKLELHRGDPRRAAEHANAVIASTGSLAAEGHLALGDAERALGELGRAREAYEVVLGMAAPGSLNACYAKLNLALTAIAEGRALDADALLAPLEHRFQHTPVPRALVAFGRLPAAVGDWSRFDELARTGLRLAAHARAVERDLADLASRAALAAESVPGGRDRAGPLRVLAFDLWTALGDAERAHTERRRLAHGVLGGAARPLGSFLLRRRLGHGANGVVWLATHAWSGTPVAVKIIPTAVSRDARAAVDREIRAMARLDHPNVIGLLDTGRVGAAAAPLVEAPEGAPWFAAELATGGTLSARCGRLPWRECRHVLSQLLEGLAHAHARGLLHLDLKPANVLLDGPVDAPLPRLADLGLARAVGGRGDGRISGTPHYMAPEQLAGDWDAQGPWTDLYALGCVATELVSGEPPFSLPNLAALVEAHLRCEPPRLRPAVAVPRGLDAWIGRLLVKSPHHRFRSAADAARALALLGPADPATVVRSPGAASPEAPTTVLTIASVDQLLPAADVPAGVCPIPTPTVPERWEPARPARSVRLLDAGLALSALRPPPFVGRREERDALWRALRDTARGRTRAVVVRGARGSGTSRIAGWLCERALEVGAASVLNGGARWDAVAEAARERPVIVRVEDALHTPDALALVLESLGRPVPALFVVTVRDEPAGADEEAMLAVLLDRPEASLVRLPPLADDEVRELLDQLLPLSPDLLGTLAARAAGSPAHVVAWIEHLVERDRLLLRADGWALRPGDDRLPPGPDAAAAERIVGVLAGTPAAAREALQLGAHLGARVPRDRWERACRALGVPADPRGFERLVEAGLCQVDDDGWIFVLGAVFDALRRDVEASPRAAILADACARALIETDGSPERIGELLLAAGRSADAVRPLLDAASRALDAARPRAAHDHAVAAEAAVRTGRVTDDDPRLGECALVALRAALRLGRADATQVYAFAERCERHGWYRLRATALGLLPPPGAAAGTDQEDTLDDLLG